MIEPNNGFKAPERKCEYFFYTVLRMTGAIDEANVARL